MTINFLLLVSATKKKDICPVVFHTFRAQQSDILQNHANYEAGKDEH